MATIFSRIVAGEIPCHKVAEDDEFFAFLDINPVAVGHTLVIPKEEINYLFDIEDAKSRSPCSGKSNHLQTCRLSGNGIGSSARAYSFDTYHEGIGYVFWRKEAGIIAG